MLIEKVTLQVRLPQPADEATNPTMFQELRTLGCRSLQVPRARGNSGANRVYHHAHGTTGAVAI